MRRIRRLTSLAAVLLLAACASAPPPRKPAVVQPAPADGFAMRKPEQISQSSDDKLGELRSVPAAKSARESSPSAQPPDRLER
jgi:hypothetical protein